MAKKVDNKHYALFEEKAKEMKIEYPVVVLYNDGGMEAYFENGIRFYLKVSDSVISFVKQKWKHSNGESTIDEYEYYIKRLLYTHTLSDAESFNELYDKFSRVSDELQNIAFEHSFEAADDANFNGFYKKKKIDEPKKEEDHPF